jgi:hypothetical protein
LSARRRSPANSPFRPVTVVVAVQDSRGDFIPNLRPENFAVFVDEVRRRDVLVSVEHALVTLGIEVNPG